MIEEEMKFTDTKTIVNYSFFHGESGSDECHITLVPVEYGSVIDQMEWIHQSYIRLLNYLNLPSHTCAFRKFFFSDLPNQYEIIRTHSLLNITENGCSVSVISQPPYPEAKIAMWAYHISDKKPEHFSDNGIRRGKLIHFWDTNITSPDKKTIRRQTTSILSKYKKLLAKRKMTLLDNLMRTWFFVQNIDTDYKEFVEARKDFFSQNGLKSETHFVASTGVGGLIENIKVKISMDAYSIAGIQKNQIQFLTAPEYISPTYIYGVTFERGTVINYKDRSHILISGTASINNRGEIVHPSNISKQLNHTLKNIEILLNQAGSNFEDVCSFIVYVRDMADAGFVYREMKKRFSNKPLILVIANVCRPGWLVEIECQAIKKARNYTSPDF